MVAVTSDVISEAVASGSFSSAGTCDQGKKPRNESSGPSK